MKAGVLHLNVKTDKIDDFQKTWNRFVGDLRKEKGLLGTVMVVNPDTGNCHSIGFYDSEESAKHIRESAPFKEFLSSVRDYLTSEPTRELCDTFGDTDRFTEKKTAA